MMLKTNLLGDTVGKPYNSDRRKEIYTQYLKNKSVPVTAKIEKVDIQTIRSIVNDVNKRHGDNTSEKDKIDFEERLSGKMFDKIVVAMDLSLNHMIKFLKEEKDENKLAKQIRDIITTFGILSDKAFKLVEIKKFGRTLNKADEAHHTMIENIITII